MQDGFQALGEAVGLLLQPHLVLYHACRIPFQLLILPAALFHDCMYVWLCLHTQGFCTSTNIWHLPVTVLITSLTHVGQEWSLLIQRAELASCQHSWTPAPVSVQLPKCLGQCYHAQQVSYSSILSPL